jgi:NAD-dependent dihydropyrimidine dehydrogenase PreA subunit
MAKRTAVVVAQSPSQNPARRSLEEEVVAGLLMEPGIELTIIPSLYDLTPSSTGMLALQGIPGTMVVVSWLYPRAAHWILDRNQIRGQVGTTLLVGPDDDDEEEEEEAEAEAKPRVVDQRPPSDRRIYCLDLRVSNRSGEYIEEIKRIHRENNVSVVSLGGIAASKSNGRPSSGNGQAPPADSAAAPQRIDDGGTRRWYPVIDYSRCTNCMECIDFCLFGVYGTDKLDTILVEQPDNCRKGCPACSRVCPENAIIFPHHKTPAIAGSPEVGASLKIDLSELFGAPDQGKSAVEVAALERDEQLVMAGRQAVGMSVGIQADNPKAKPVARPQAAGQTSTSSAPKDDLDALIDAVDAMDR